MSAFKKANEFLKLERKKICKVKRWKKSSRYGTFTLWLAGKEVVKGRIGVIARIASNDPQWPKKDSQKIDVYKKFIKENYTDKKIQKALKAAWIAFQGG